MGSGPHPVIRFATFEVNSVTGELRKGDRRVNLQEQPLRVLMLLLEHPGEVVTREVLRERLWGENYVDFEEGINTAVRKLRDALGDSATSPRFIETLPRRGYRFVAPAEVVCEGPDAEPGVPQRSSARGPRVAGIMVVLFVAGFLVRGWLVREKTAWNPSPPVQLTRDSGLTTDPVISRDGKMLAYASDRSGEGNLDIWVQSVSGGAARRLTDDAADDHEPDISPDDSEIIFRSERDGGGIYAVPILSGQARLVIKGGYVPRFSPDGTEIAYATGLFGSGGFAGKLHVYTPTTGLTRSLAPDLFVVGPVAWSPEGKSLVFAGANNYGLRPIYLWTCSAEGGPAVQMSARPITEDQAFVGQVSTVSLAWLNRELIVSANRGDTSNLWTATLLPGLRSLAGEPRRITLGSASETLPSVSGGGRVVFASHSYSTGIWEASLGEHEPVLRRITEDRALNYHPSVTADGTRMAYVSNRAGKFDVWVKDLRNGNEAVLARTDRAAVFAAISRDASHVAFTDGDGIYLLSTTGGATRRLCERCGRPADWTPDGQLITAPPGPQLTAIAVWNPATGLATKIATHPTLFTTGPRISPDGRWLAFHTAENVTAPERRLTAKRQIFIAPYNGLWAPLTSWIAVTDGNGLDREASWSADGNRIYFLSDRDGFRCIWGRKLDRKTKQPLGVVYPVLHLHNARVSLRHVPNTGYVGVSSVGAKLIFALGELTGNIWMTELGHP